MESHNNVDDESKALHRDHQFSQVFTILLTHAETYNCIANAEPKTATSMAVFLLKKVLQFRVSWSIWGVAEESETDL
jgi:hypothetical protein